MTPDPGVEHGSLLANVAINFQRAAKLAIHVGKCFTLLVQFSPRQQRLGIGGHGVAPVSLDIRQCRHRLGRFHIRLFRLRFLLFRRNQDRYHFGSSFLSCDLSSPVVGWLGVWGGV